MFFCDFFFKKQIFAQKIKYFPIANQLQYLLFCDIIHKNQERRRYSQVVRPGSAKPLCPGSNPGGASKNVDRTTNVKNKDERNSFLFFTILYGQLIFYGNKGRVK